MIARQLKQLHALSLALLGQYLKQTRFGGFLLFGFSMTQLLKTLQAGGVVTVDYGVVKM